VDSILVICIVATPFIFYLYTLFPDVKRWETRFFVYESNYFESVYAFAWTFLQKFCFLWLMLIWFFTNKYWWNKALLVPIGMIFYQIIILVNDDIRLKDNQVLDKFFLIPLVVGICIALLLIRNKLSIYIQAFDLKEEIENKIKEVEKEVKNDNRNIN
tara:strand:+ start:3228 stop:3701 length:474 start_codon:yes stop_codon:yes gene_type:complete